MLCPTKRADPYASAAPIRRDAPGQARILDQARATVAVEFDPLLLEVVAQLPISGGVAAARADRQPRLLELLLKVVDLLLQLRAAVLGGLGHLVVSSV